MRTQVEEVALEEEIAKLYNTLYKTWQDIDIDHIEGLFPLTSKIWKEQGYEYTNGPM